MHKENDTRTVAVLVDIVVSGHLPQEVVSDHNAHIHMYQNSILFWPSATRNNQNCVVLEVLVNVTELEGERKGRIGEELNCVGSGCQYSSSHLHELKDCRKMCNLTNLLNH